METLNRREKDILFYQPKPRHKKKNIKRTTEKHLTRKHKSIKLNKALKYRVRRAIALLLIPVTIFIAIMLVDLAKVGYYSFFVRNTPEQAVSSIVNMTQSDIKDSIANTLKTSKINEINIVEMDFDRIISDLSEAISEKIEYSVDDVQYTEYKDLLVLNNKIPIQGFITMHIKGIDMAGYGDDFLYYMKNDLYDTLKENIEAEVNGSSLPDNYKTYSEWFIQPVKYMENVVDSKVDIVVELDSTGHWVVQNKDDALKCISLAMLLNSQSEMKYIADNTSTLDNLKSYLYTGQVEELLNYSMNLMLNTEDEDYSEHIDSTMVAGVLDGGIENTEDVNLTGVPKRQ